LQCLCVWCRSQFLHGQSPVRPSGLIVDLPVFFRVCALIAVAALPLVLLMLWLEFASRRDGRDEPSRE
jgi:hypothetical protein